MTKDEFIEARTAAARAKAEIEWEKNQKTYSTTPKGVEFAKWVQKSIETYSQEAEKSLNDEKKGQGICACNCSKSISSAVHAFVLHLIRRNCRVGTQLKSIAVDDISKGKKIVDFVIDLCLSYRWKTGE